MTTILSKSVRLCAVFAIVLGSVSAWAAAEPEQRMIDKRFGYLGRATAVFDRPGSDFRDDGYAVVEQSDGKLVLAGVVALSGGRTGVGVARLQRDGAIDISFGEAATPGKYVFDLNPSTSTGAYAAAVQSDNKIVVAGWITGAAHQGENFLVLRLNANGTLDTSFGLAGRAVVAFDAGGTMDDWATGVAIQGDGRIVVVGNVQRFATHDRDIGVLRLNSTGGADTSFGASGKTIIVVDRGGDNDAQATSLALQSDGKIAIGGWASTSSNGKDAMALRLLSTGAVDTGFGTSASGITLFNLPGSRTCLDDTAHAITAVTWTQLAVPTPIVQRRLILAGTACVNNTAPAGEDWDFQVLRLRDDGSLDTTLNGAGYRLLAMDLGGFNNDIATSVMAYNQSPLPAVLLPPTHIVVAGSAYDTRPPGDRGNQLAVQMIRWNGEREAGFGNGGRGYIDFDYGGNNFDWGNGMILTQAGKAVIVGTVERATGNDYDYAVTRIVLDRIFMGNQEND